MSRGGTEEKDILERKPAGVCDRYFVSFQGRLKLHGTSTISISIGYRLGKTDYKGNERKEQNQKAAEEKAERVKEHRKRSIERQEVKVAEKRKNINVSADRVVDIHFTGTSTSTSTEEVEEDPGIAHTTEMDPSESSCSTTTEHYKRCLKTTLKEASQSLQKTPKHKTRSLNTCFIGQLIKLRTESISDLMIKLRGYHPTRFS